MLNSNKNLRGVEFKLNFDQDVKNIEDFISNCYEAFKNALQFGTTRVFNKKQELILTILDSTKNRY